MIDDGRVYFSAKDYVVFSSEDEILGAIATGTGPKDGHGNQLLSGDQDLSFWVGKKIGLGRPYKKSFWEEKDEKTRPISGWLDSVSPNNDSEIDQIIVEIQKAGPAEIVKIFGSKVFQNAKPVSLLKNLLRVSADTHDIILDFFAGSATTAQAVMELNAEDQGERRFIMVSSTEATVDEPSKNICRDITSERIRRLNRSDDDKYAALAAEFAYLKCREIRFEDLDQEIVPQEVWTSIEAIHDLPLTSYDSVASWQEHQAIGETVIYADKVTDALFLRIDALLATRANLFIYVWAPGQLDRYKGRDVEIRQVREALVKRFQQ